jgi:integrase/recombinase XerC
MTNTEHKDLVRNFLNSKKSIATRYVYEKDLSLFFGFVGGSGSIEQLADKFLSLSQQDAVAIVLRYKSRLLADNLKSATINRRLSTIKSLVAFANKWEKCNISLNAVKNQEPAPYRDTTGLTADQFRQIIAVPDRTTPQGKRDYALLLLMWSNILRRNEVRVMVKDFNAENATLTITGKGRTTPEEVQLPLATVEAINDWLECRGNVPPSAPLFIALDRVNYGHSLTGNGIYSIVLRVAKKAGLEKRFSPNRLKHSAVTAMLNEGTHVRGVMKLTRHRSCGTLLIYDDTPVDKDAQKKISEMASKLV